MNNATTQRLQVKTPQQQCLHELEQGFHYAPRVAQAILEEAQACLLGAVGTLAPGQMRAILAKREAGHGRPLSAVQTSAVVWTIDAGAEDLEVLRRHGSVALRQVRLQRLLDEALDQGAVATQEDLARALQTSLRTIKRDCAVLTAQGVYLPLRGNLHGIGRGQTHKAQIVGLWLEGQTYDQIELRTHHTPNSIRRYINTFARVVWLQQHDYTVAQIAQLLQIGTPLVKEYLAVYQRYNTPQYAARLQDCLKRVCEANEPLDSKKGGP